MQLLAYKGILYRKIVLGSKLWGLVTKPQLFQCIILTFPVSYNLYAIYPTCIKTSNGSTQGYFNLEKTRRNKLLVEIKPFPLLKTLQPKAVKYTTGFHLGHLQEVSSKGSASRFCEPSLSTPLSENGRQD